MKNKSVITGLAVLLLGFPTIFLWGCKSDGTNQSEKIVQTNPDCGLDTTAWTAEQKLAKRQMEVRIDSLNKRMMEIYRSTNIPDLKTAMYAVQAYEYFAHDYEKDEKAGMLLMKAGEIYENVIKDKDRAIRRYQSAYLHPCDFENKPMSLFRSANLYVEANDTTRAIKSFELFIEKYPEHDFADDAANIIKVTRSGLTMEEFIQKSIENNSGEVQ